MSDQMLGGLFIVITVVGGILIKKFFAAYPLPGEQRGDKPQDGENP